MLTFPFNTDVRFTLIPMVGGVKIEQSDMEDLTVRIENKNRGVLFDPKWDITDKGIEIEIQREKIPFATSYNVVAEWRRPDSSFFDGYQDIHHSCNAIEFKKDCNIQCGNGVLMVEASQCYKGTPGVGVPKGGAPGQALVKKTNEDYDTEWKTLSSGTGTGDGKTPVIGSITAESIPSTEAPSFSLTHTSNDGDGNPVYTGTIKIPKGKDGKDGIDGKTPVFEIGTVETLAAGSQATASIVPDGETTEGNPKYKVSFGIPKGANGTGEGGGTTNPEWTDIEGKPSWIGVTKPTYTANEVGALPTAHNTDTEAHGGIATKVSTLESKVQTLENTETVTANLEIKKIYSSIAVMESDFSTTDVAFGEFVAIESNDDDNGSLFIKNTSNWGYMGKVGQSAGDSYIPNNLIDFDKIVVGKKITGFTVNNTAKTWEAITEDNPDFAYYLLDPMGLTDRFTLQGMRNDDSGNNFALGGVWTPSTGSSQFVVNLESLVDANANDLYTTHYTSFKLGSTADRVFKIIGINIPIDSSKKLANIHPSTSELTIYRGWDRKEFDAPGITPPKSIQRTRELADNRYLYRVGAGNFHVGFIPVDPAKKYIVSGLYSHNLIGAVVVYDANYVNIGSFTAYQLSKTEQVDRITGRKGGVIDVSAYPNAAFISVKVTHSGSEVGSYDYVRNNELNVQEIKYGFEFAGLFEPIEGVGRSEFEKQKEFHPANKRLNKLLNLAFVGDSQTVAGWYKYMQDYLQIDSLVSKAVGGIAWTGITPYFDALIQDYQSGTVTGVDGKIVNSPDYVFMLVTNTSTANGDPKTVMAKNISQLDPTLSQSESIRYNINRLRTVFPDAMLIIFTPFQLFVNGGAADDSRREKGLIMQDMAERMSVRCYNLWNTLGIDPAFEALGSEGRYLSSDGIHVNENGKMLLSKYAAQIIKSLEI